MTTRLLFKSIGETVVPANANFREREGANEREREGVKNCSKDQIADKGEREGKKRREKERAVF